MATAMTKMRYRLHFVKQRVVNFTTNGCKSWPGGYGVRLINHHNTNLLLNYFEQKFFSELFSDSRGKSKWIAIGSSIFFQNSITRMSKYNLHPLPPLKINVPSLILKMHLDLKGRFRPSSDYSQLSINGHLYKTDTSVRRALGVGPCAPFFSHVTVSKLSSGHLSKTDTWCWSLRAIFQSCY